MRDSDARMDQKEEKRHKFKFSWSWFRHRKKGNKIDRRAQIEKDMKSNWAELPATLRRKQKLSQQVLDEYTRDPDTEQKAEELYSEVKKGRTEASGMENGSHSREDTVVKVAQCNGGVGSDGDRIEVKNGETDHSQDISEVNPSVQQFEHGEKEYSCEHPVGNCLENDLSDEVTIKIAKVEEITVEVVEEIESKTTEQRLKLELPSNALNESDGDGDLWLEREQQRVMQLLHRAVSEDSLLVVSSASDESSSEDELVDDSGTDINNPSSSSSCTNETFMSVPNNVDETFMSVPNIVDETFMSVPNNVDETFMSVPNNVDEAYMSVPNIVDEAFMSVPNNVEERDTVVETLLAIQTSHTQDPTDQNNRESIVQSFPHTRESVVQSFLDTQDPTDQNNRESIVQSFPHTRESIVQSFLDTRQPTDQNTRESIVQSFLDTRHPTDQNTRESIVQSFLVTQDPTDENTRESKVQSFLDTQDPSDYNNRDSIFQSFLDARDPTDQNNRESILQSFLDTGDSADPSDQLTPPDTPITHTTITCGYTSQEQKDVFELPISIPRAGLHHEERRTDEETAMAFYDAVVEGGDADVEDGEQQLSLELIEEEDFSQLVDRMQFSTGAKWKKALLMQTLGRKPKGMATIVEESTPSPDEEQLTVRGILRRFEELGCKTLPAEEKSATLKEIHDTLRCLEEKVRGYEAKLLQSKNAPRITNEPYHHQGGNAKVSAAVDNWAGRGQHQVVSTTHAVMPSHHPPVSTATQHAAEETHDSMGQHDGKHSLLQFAINHFRASPEKFEMLKTADGSISGSLKVIESHKNTKKKEKNKKDKDKDKDKGSNKENDWTWKEQVDLVKFSNAPVEQSLLRLDSPELSELAVECFTSVMRYMGDLPMTTDLSEVKCVYTILMHCHKHESLRDEVYCQLMKQTTNNKSIKPDSCQRGWRLFSIVAAYFTCSDTLKPYLFKYLETAAYDKRRAYHGTATVCLQNLRKTFRHGGRKNVPSVEELTAISAGRNSKRQIYRLPGGSERVVNTKSTTVVQDVIEEMCAVINVQTSAEMEEFSLYCIVEGDTFTMPLARDEYILDVTTELHKNQQVFYLIFCRSVWHFPLRLDSQLYIEVVFNQIAPDYLEGLLLVMPGEQLDQDVIYDIAKMASLLHRAADMPHIPTMKEVKFLLPKPALAVRDVKPGQWVNMVQGNWREVEPLQTIQAKAQVLEILSKWPLFGSSFFAVKRISDPKDRADHILALNRHGVHFIDLITHETLIHYPFSEVISTRKVKSEDGTLFLDMKCGNLMQQRITRLQTDQAHEISRLIRQYITMEQKLRS